MISSVVKIKPAKKWDDSVENEKANIEEKKFESAVKCEHL